MIEENEEMKELVEICNKWREAKLQIELEKLKKKEEPKQLEKKPEEYTAKKECEKAGYYWYENKCHAEPPESQQPSEEEQKKAKDLEENQGKMKEDNPEGSEKQEG